MVTNLDLAEAGLKAADLLWREGLAAEIDDPLDPEFAAAAVAEFAHLLSEHTPGILRDALEGAEKSAEQLSVEPLHGIIEVVQNADDAGASRLRLAVRKRSGGRDLLFAHDGKPVRLPDVIAMVLAFVSTKRGDSMKKGRFGIGLKTLSALGDTLSVHCGPYHVQITGNQLKQVLPAKGINGFYQPDTSETLLELRLRAGFDEEQLSAWIKNRDASSLLFLDSVRSLGLFNLRSRKPIVEHRLEERGTEDSVIRFGRQTLACTETRLEDHASGCSWRRYLV